MIVACRWGVVTERVWLGVKGISSVVSKFKDPRLNFSNWRLQVNGKQPVYSKY